MQNGFMLTQMICGSRSAVLGLGVFLLAHAMPACAQDPSADAAGQQTDREALRVSDYKNLTIIVLEVDANTANITEKDVRARTESRMKDSGIIPRNDANDRFLYVFVHVDGDAFNIDIGFYREASWQLPDGKTAHNFLETWNSGHTLGTHGNSAASIIKALDGRLDLFITAYLKANQNSN